jgi:c-di-GMP-related signal transduction protein
MFLHRKLPNEIKESLDKQDAKLREKLQSDEKEGKKDPQQIDEIVAEVRRRAEDELEKKYNEALKSATEKVINNRR